MPSWNRSAGESRPGLAIDTSFSRHRGQAPRQVFPLKPRQQELSFVSFSDIKALREKNRLQEQKLSTQAAQDNALVRPGAERSMSETSTEQAIKRPGHYRKSSAAELFNDEPQFKLQAPPKHKRIKGLRTTPLELDTDISPSDRAIPIGFAIDRNPQSNAPYPQSPPERQTSQRIGQDLKTPTIIITPAEEDFEFGFSASPRFQGGLRRPTPSIYSFHNLEPEHAPPVPPLPLFAKQSNTSLRSGATRESLRSHMTRDSTMTMFEEEAAPPCPPVPYTDDAPFGESARRRGFSQATLPTPRRSKGWWNVITSPFSTRASEGFFRSPPPVDEHEENRSILSSAANMGTCDPHAGVIFINRDPDDYDLRSAPPVEGTEQKFDDVVPLPRRHNTTTGALDLGNADQVNIYRQPSYGAAASYYDTNRHFPSLIGPVSGLGTGDRGLDDLAVPFPYDEPQRIGSGERGIARSPGEDRTPNFVVPPYPVDASNAGMEQPVDMPGPPSDENSRELHCDDISESPVQRLDGLGATRSMHSSYVGGDDHDRETVFEDDSGTYPAASGGFFTTPSEDELRGSHEQRFSPLSPSPVVGNAHIAQMMGPQSTNGELREVELSRTPLQPVSGPGLGEATMASRGMSMSEGDTLSEKTSEYGDFDASGRGSDVGLFPPSKPQPVFRELEKRGLEQSTHDDRAPSRPWYKRFLVLILVLIGLLFGLLTVLLVMLLPVDHSDIPVEAQWLNLTGFPPLPTGVATVIGAQNVNSVDGCVKPAALWNCDVPAGQGKTASKPDEPNFRFEIRFRHRTSLNETTLQPEDSQASNNSSLTARAGALVRRSAWTNFLFTPSPSIPSTNDQIFLGRTTDSNSQPVNGEETPFYIYMLNATSLSSAQETGLQKRDSKFRYPYPTSKANNSSHSITGQGVKPSGIPAPELRDNGEFAPAELYPLAYAQPLRLFNRGQSDEYYGFYTYFDRSLYISSASSNSSSESFSITEDATANVGLKDATAVCTWSQTRFFVQLWTRKPDVTTLGFSPNASNIPAVHSTANVMTGHGSFPYSVSVTLDRHGGQASEKGVYCYGLDSNARVLTGVKTWIKENRGFNGTLVNPAAVPTNNGDNRDSTSGNGIDGGSGGCSCRWQT